MKEYKKGDKIPAEEISEVIIMIHPTDDESNTISREFNGVWFHIIESKDPIEVIGDLKLFKANLDIQGLKPKNIRILANKAFLEIYDFIRPIISGWRWLSAVGGKILNF
jgi:hypothetical protein